MIFNDPISQRDFAKLVGTSRIGVRNLINSGVLQVDDKHKLSRSVSKVAYDTYIARTNPEKLAAAPAEPKPKSGAAAIAAVQAELASGSFTADQYLDRLLNELDMTPEAAYTKARAFNEILRARQAALDADIQSGNSFTFEQIKLDMQKVFGAVRAKLLTVPNRMATVCEGRNARDIEELIGDEINKALEEFGNSKFA